jgi:hypothetical protein
MNPPHDLDEVIDLFLEPCSGCLNFAQCAEFRTIPETRVVVDSVLPFSMSERA